MATPDHTTGDRPRGGSGGLGGSVGNFGRRLSTETKQFFKTSEFVAYVLMVIAILIAGNSIEAEEGGNDFFAADKVWLYITLLTIGYMLSRGIAKAGSSEPYSDDDGDHR
jgi:hypothetical protein